MGNSIEKLQRVPLREVWKHEAYDFTQWLQENLDILNDTLDLELTSDTKEIFYLLNCSQIELYNFSSFS